MGAYRALKPKWLPRPELEWSALALLRAMEPHAEEIVARIKGRFADWLRAQGAEDVTAIERAIRFSKGGLRYELALFHEGTTQGVGFVLSSSEQPIPLNKTGLLVAIPALAFALIATFYAANYLPFMRTSCFGFFGIFLVCMAVVLAPTAYMLDRLGLLKGLIPKRPMMSREEKEARLKFSEEILKAAVELSKAEGLECRKC